MGLKNWFKNSYLYTELEVGKYTRRRGTRRSNSLSDAQIIMNYIQNEVLVEDHKTSKSNRSSNKSSKKKHLTKEEKTERDLKAIENYIGVQLMAPKKNKPSSRSTANSSQTSDEFFQDNFVSKSYTHHSDSVIKRNGHNQGDNNEFLQQGSSKTNPLEVEFVDLDSYFDRNQGHYYGK